MNCWPSPTSIPAWAWSVWPCVMQDVNNLFEVDTVAAVLHHVERIAGKKYEEE